MKNIITITLNPAFDIHCSLEEFIPFSENYVKSTLKSAGGKGINISRSLLSGDIKSNAIVVMGKENSQEFIHCLTADGIDYTPIYTDGRIRENFTFHSQNQRETRISFDDFYCDDIVLEQINKLVDKSTAAVAFAGRLPKGISKKCVIDFLKSIKEKGIFLCVDSNSFTAEDLLEIRPDFIKPNEVEIKALSNGDIKTAAKKLYSLGIRHVLITSGGDNAVYMGEEGLKEISVPKVNPLSTVGAGDSTIAGFLSEYIKDSNINACLRTAIAFGSAATLKEGTTAPDKEDIKRLIREVEIRNI